MFAIVLIIPMCAQLLILSQYLIILFISLCSQLLIVALQLKSKRSIHPTAKQPSQKNTNLHYSSSQPYKQLCRSPLQTCCSHRSCLLEATASMRVRLQRSAQALLKKKELLALPHPGDLNQSCVSHAQGALRALLLLQTSVFPDWRKYRVHRVGLVAARQL